MPNTTYALGRIGLNLRGGYEASASYEKLDVVSYLGSSYVAKGETSGNAPTEGAYWEPLAQGITSGYSAQEQDTGWKWIDGKTIYRQVLSIPAAQSNGAYLSASLGISAVATLVHMWGTVIAPDGDLLPLAYPHPGALASQIRFNLRSPSSNPYVQVASGGNANAKHQGGFVVVEYTKP